VAQARQRQIGDRARVLQKVDALGRELQHGIHVIGLTQQAARDELIEVAPDLIRRGITEQTEHTKGLMPPRRYQLGRLASEDIRHMRGAEPLTDTSNGR
jgi:hypothetical protein